MFLIFGVLAAVLSARTTGEGQVVDAAMVDGSASLLTFTHAMMNTGFWRDERGTNLLDTGAHFYDVYETKDHQYVAVGAIEAKFYDLLVERLGLKGDEIPAQYDRRAWPEMKERFTEIFAQRTRDEWTEVFADVDACVTPVLSAREAVLHPYNSARGVFSIEGAVQPQPAPRFSRSPGEIGQPPGKPGSGTRSGLAGWGIDDDRQEALRAAGAFG